IRLSPLYTPTLHDALPIYGAGDSQNFDYRIYGKTFTRGPEFHSDQGRFDDWRMGQAGFRTDWNPNKRDSFTFQGDLYKGEEGERSEEHTSELQSLRHLVCC